MTIRQGWGGALLYYISLLDILLNYTLREHHWQSFSKSIRIKTNVCLFVLYALVNRSRDEIPQYSRPRDGEGL